VRAPPLVDNEDDPYSSDPDDASLDLRHRGRPVLHLRSTVHHALGGVSSSPGESTFLSCRSLRAREREEACEREREEAHNENWCCMSVLHFCVVGKARSKMGSTYGSSVGDHLGVLQCYFVPHFEFCSFRWR
jgi:hypothetical protein